MAKPIYRTWPLLETHSKGRKPNDYQIVNYKLNYTFRGHGEAPRFELDPKAPIVAWHSRYREGSSFSVPNWDGFEDPDQLVYWGYCARQDNAECYIDRLVEQGALDGRDRNLRRAWLLTVRDCLGPLRFPYHGLQMMHMYLMQLAPASTIANCFAYGAADQLRVVERIAYRLKMLDVAHEELSFGKEDRKTWEEGSAFQPLREVVEKSLVAYDWGESFCAVGLVLKPLLDEVVFIHFADLARANQDYVLHGILRNLYIDSLRHHRWTAALARFAISENPANRGLLEQYLRRWFDRAWKGIEALRPAFDTKGVEPVDFATAVSSARETHARFLESASLGGVLAA